jgi:hypothetical protein
MMGRFSVVSKPASTSKKSARSLIWKPVPLHPATVVALPAA